MAPIPFSKLWKANSLALASTWTLIILGIIASRVEPSIHTETIAKFLFWIGFSMDLVICEFEFLIVWWTVQAPSKCYYFGSVYRYLSYLCSFVACFVLISPKLTTLEFVITIAYVVFLRTIGSVYVACVYSNEVDGTGPVYPVGQTGINAIAGA